MDHQENIETGERGFPFAADDLGAMDIEPVRHCADCEHLVFLGRVPSGHLFELVAAPVFEIVDRQDSQTKVLTVDHPHHSGRFVTVHQCWVEQLKQMKQKNKEALCLE